MFKEWMMHGSKRAITCLVALALYSSAAPAQEHVNPAIVEPSSFGSKSAGPKTYSLTRNVADKKTVARLYVSENGMATLINRTPEGPLVQNWPDFRLVTPAAVEQAWGSATGCGRGYQTFGLYNPAGELFSVDLHFVKARLVRYRVHGPRIKSLWVAVPKQFGPQKENDDSDATARQSTNSP